MYAYVSKDIWYNCRLHWLSEQQTLIYNLKCINCRRISTWSVCVCVCVWNALIFQTALLFPFWYFLDSGHLKQPKNQRGHLVLNCVNYDCGSSGCYRSQFATFCPCLVGSCVATMHTNERTHWIILQWRWSVAQRSSAVMWYGCWRKTMSHSINSTSDYIHDSLKLTVHPGAQKRKI